MRALFATLLCLAVFVGGAPEAWAGDAAGSVLNARPRLAANVLTGLNRVRSAHGLRTLGANADLAAAAREHSVEMLSVGYFGHDSADGSPFWARVGRRYGNQRMGENLLWSIPDISPGRAVAEWLRSPEHRAVILDPLWREIGIGAAHSQSAAGVFEGQAVTVITTDFGVRP